MFIEMTDDEMINFNYVATIRKVYSKTYNSFAIYVNTVGEDGVVLKFETEEEMEKKWRWLQHNVPRQQREWGRVMDDYCYECTGYGDDYYYDEELDDLVCACDDCPYNDNNWEDGYWRDDI